MEQLNLGMQGGAPIKQRTLNVLQDMSFGVLKTLIAHLGISNSGYFILDGCEVVGANITAGIMYINGELCSFIGAAGTADSEFTKVKYLDSVAYKNGQYMPMFEENKAVIVTVGKKLKDFKRIPKVQELVNQLTDWNDIINKPAVVIDPANLTATPPEKTVLQRLEKLERQNAVFITGGGMVLWNRPANEIPTDWQEVVNWKGRMPVGVNDQLNAVGQFIDPEFAPYPNTANSNSLTVAGRTGGYKTHQITKNELPAISPGNVPIINQDLTNDGPTNGRGSTENPSYQPLPNLGNGEAMPILNPYRTVYFIEYIGN